MTAREEEDDWTQWESLRGDKKDVDEQIELCNKHDIPIRLVRARMKDGKEYLVIQRWVGPDV